MIYLFSSTLTLLIFIHHDCVLFKHIDSFDLYPSHSPSKTNVSDDDDLSESTQIVRQFNVYQVSHLQTLTKRNNSCLLESLTLTLGQWVHRSSLRAYEGVNRATFHNMINSDVNFRRQAVSGDLRININRF